MVKELGPRLCRLCGKPFRPAVGWQKYHPKCGNRARVARYLEKHGFKK